MEIQSDIDQKISVLHEKTRILLAQNKQESEVILELTKDGIDEAYAELIIENVKTDLSDKTEFRKELFKGIGITSFGLLLNISSYFAFASTGTFFWVLYWGIMVAGVTLIARAFIIFKK